MDIALSERPNDLPIETGFEVYVLTDASLDAYESPVQRKVQAVVRPITAQTYLFERRRDWSRAETYDPPLSSR